MNKKGWGIILFLLMGGLFFHLFYTHHHPPAKKYSSTKPSYNPGSNFINQAQKSKAIPSASAQKPFPERLSAKPSSTKEASPVTTLSLPDEERMVEEPANQVFFGYLKLVGTTVFDYNPLKNKAIIEDLLTSRQKLYLTGSVIPYGAKIVQINEKGIMLEKEGVKKRLLVAEKLGDPGDIAALRTKGYKRVSGKEWLIRPNCLIKNTENIYALLKQVNLQPYINAGKIEGFLVNKIKPGTVINELGIEGGDVISTVNGKTIEGLTEAYEVYQQIRNEPLINIGVFRQQQEITLAYHIIADGPPKYSVKDALWSPLVAKLFGAKGGQAQD